LSRVADVRATGITPDDHPVEHFRDHRDWVGAIPTAAIADVPDGTRVLVGGAVTGGARGLAFLN